MPQPEKAAAAVREGGPVRGGHSGPNRRGTSGRTSSRTPSHLHRRAARKAGQTRTEKSRLLGRKSRKTAFSIQRAGALGPETSLALDMSSATGTCEKQAFVQAWQVRQVEKMSPAALGSGFFPSRMSR